MIFRYVSDVLHSINVVHHSGAEGAVQAYGLLLIAEVWHMRDLAM
jgi:hypothetical protein